MTRSIDEMETPIKKYSDLAEDEIVRLRKLLDLLQHNAYGMVEDEDDDIMLHVAQELSLAKIPPEIYERIQDRIPEPLPW